MAGDKIRGLTVEISADAKQFKKEISGLSAEVKSATQELSALQQGLDLEFNSEKFKQAQKVAQQALDATSAKVNALKDRLQYLESINAADTDEYKKLQTELAKTETAALKLTKQIDELNKLPLENLTKKVDKLAGGFEKAGKALAPVSAATAGGIAALGALGLKAVSTADDIATAAVSLGITAEEVQKFNYIALQTDTSSESLTKGFIKVRATLADLSSGTINNATKALETLRLDMSKFSTTDEAFYGIIDALGKIDNDIDMAAAANEIFGDKLANDLIPIIKSGGDAVAALGAEYEMLGGLTNDQVEKLAAFDNVLNKIKIQLQNVFLQIGAALLPVMEKLAAFISERLIPQLEKLSGWFSNLTTEQIEFGLKALAAVAMLAPLLTMIGKITGAISGIIKIIPALKAGLSALAANPIIAIIGIIAILLTVLYTQNEAFRESINRLLGVIGASLAPLLDIVMGLLDSLMQILSPLIDMIGNLLANALNIVLDALSPFFEMLQLIFSLIEPLIQVALLPLQLSLLQLSIPLKMLGALLGWLAPLFNAFSSLVSSVFNFIVNKVINPVLKAIESAINWVIDKVNGLIDGINALGGWLGIHIDRLSKVSLQIQTETIGGNSPSVDMDTTPPDFAYDQIGAGDVYGDTYNYDYSKNDTTQNVTVTIQNYAAEIDVDDMVRRINTKLAEVM